MGHLFPYESISEVIVEFDMYDLTYTYLLYMEV